MKKIIFLTIFLITLTTLCFSFTITSNGFPKATIVLSETATEADNYATDEFIKYVELISGAELEVSNIPQKGNNIYIGEISSKDIMSRLKPDFDWDSLKTNGILIFSKEDSLVLAGENSGTIYAVYTFLENYFGVQFLTPDDEYIPFKSTMTCGNIDLVYKSPFISRASNFTLNFQDYQYSLKLKQNDHYNIIPKELGGNVVINGFVHTFKSLINPEEYKETHPEYFTLFNGERITDETGQLCLSNPELVKELIKNVKNRIKNNPNDTIFSVSQNDNTLYCTCPNCEALAEKYGQSGVLLTVINQIADAIKDEYPDKYIETLAYRYTRQVPKGGIVPRDNVIIRLCDIECDFGHNLQHPNNENFWKDLQDWSKICKNIYLWDYVSNFSDYIICHPNTQILQSNIQLMAENNVVAVFEEGDYENTDSCLNHYKRYILAKLLWNPYMDMEKETKAFFNNFYGPAGSDMLKFKNATELPFKRSNDIKLYTYMLNNNYFTTQDWITCFTHLNNALKKVQGNEKYYNRVYTDMICFYAGVLYTDNSVRAELDKSKLLPFKSDKEFLTKLTEFAPNHGIDFSAEHFHFSDSYYFAQDNVKAGIQPKEVTKINDNEWEDLQEYNLCKPSELENQPMVVTDFDASNDKTLMIPASNITWCVKKALSYYYFTHKGKKGDIYITYKVTGDKPKKAFFGGVYNQDNGYIFSTDFGTDDTPDEKYITKKLGTVDFNDSNIRTYLFFGGSDAKNTSKMYIDRIFIIFHN